MVADTADEHPEQVLAAAADTGTSNRYDDPTGGRDAPRVLADLVSPRAYVRGHSGLPSRLLRASAVIRCRDVAGGDGRWFGLLVDGVRSPVCS